MKEEQNMPNPIPMNEFTELSQKKMVEVLRDFDEQHGTDHAVGQSRARKADLEAIYAKVLEGGIETGRLRSDKPNEGGKPQAAPPKEEEPVESDTFPTQTVFLRREHGVFFFIRTGNEKRQLSSKESWMLSRVKKLRDEIGPVYVSGDGRRSNPSKNAKQELRTVLRRLNKPHGIVCVSDAAVKKMHEAQQQGQAAQL